MSHTYDRKAIPEPSKDMGSTILNPPARDFDSEAIWQHKYWFAKNVLGLNEDEAREDADLTLEAFNETTADIQTADNDS